MTPRPSPARRALRGLVAAALLTLAGCGPSGDTDGPGGGNGAAAGPRSVLLVCLDTVRADHLGFLGYDRRPTTPALDALAERSLVFTDTTAQACWTKPSVPSFFTGSPPASHGVYRGSTQVMDRMETDILGDEATTLAERFAEAGYDTAAFLHNAQLAPGAGLEQGFAVYEEGDLDAAGLADAAITWLEDRGDDERPFFLYLHVLDAHWPFDVPDEAALRFAPRDALSMVRRRDWRQLIDDLNKREVELSAEQIEGVLALYDAALRYSDEHVGRVLERLEQRGELDDMVVAVVADHGEEFDEHARYGHGHGLWENLTRVGWTLAGPDLTPGRVEVPTSLLDLYPSVLAAAGLPAPEIPFGVDRTREPARHGVVFAEHVAGSRYVQSLRRDGIKLVRRFETETPALPIHSLDLDTRWEAELSPDGRATQLKTRDESAFDPPELRGPVEAVDEESLTLVGYQVRFDDDTRVYGEAETFEAITPGRVVKAEGEWNGEFILASKIKVYEDGTDPTPEIRGGVTGREATEAGGVVWLSELPVRFDYETVFKGASSSPRIGRDDLRRVLEEGAAVTGLVQQFTLYDLDADPGETTPVEQVSEVAAGSDRLRALSEELDRVGRLAYAAGTWSSADGQVLDQETLDELRALGYIK